MRAAGARFEVERAARGAWTGMSASGQERRAYAGRLVGRNRAAPRIERFADLAVPHSGVLSGRQRAGAPASVDALAFAPRAWAGANAADLAGDEMPACSRGS